MSSGQRTPRDRSRKQNQRSPHRTKDPEAPIRLNRYIARAGVCSRRSADELIKEGRVLVNGEVVTNFGTRVSASDVVSVNGRRISPARHQYILVNKPRDTITTTDDDRYRQTVLDLLRISDDEKRGLFPVGRLDRHTTGVLLLTNDGELAHRLMHPRHEIEKLYVVDVDRPVDAADVRRLVDGVELDDGPAKADYADLPDSLRPDRVGLSIHEGRNRQIRRMMEKLGYRVKKLWTKYF